MTTSFDDRGAAFRTTSWSLVARASGPLDDASRAALESLCRTYWYPLYAYARRRGESASDAEDAVQGFFTLLLENGDLRAVTRDKGRFRSFLLAALQHHLANRHAGETAQKRGGGRVRLAIDADEAGARFAREPSLERTPEEEFERVWALAVLQRALAELEAEYRASSRGELFDALAGELQGEPAPHAEIAEQLGLSAGAVRVAAHRLRERFGDKLREHVAETVSSPAEIEAELGALLRAFAR